MYFNANLRNITDKSMPQSNFITKNFLHSIKRTKFALRMGTGKTLDPHGKTTLNKIINN